MAANLTAGQWNSILDQVNQQLGTHLKLAPSIVYEIVVYALIIFEETRDYAFLELTVYTAMPVSVADVFRCIEQQGFRLQRREAGINRIEVNELKIGRMPRELPEGREIVEDWCDYIISYIDNLTPIPPKSGHYWRKRAGITSSEERRRRREKMEARTKAVQENLDRYGL